MPVYVAIDESPAMRHCRDQLAEGMAALCDSLRAEPMTSAKLRICILGYAGDTTPRLPLSDPRTIIRPPEPIIRPALNHSALFADLLSRIPHDVQQLKASGHKVQRPLVFILTSGQTTGPATWRNEHQKLTDRTTLPAAPNIIAFGIDSPPDTAREIATHPEFAYLTPPGTSTPTAITDFFHATATSLLESARALGSPTAGLTISDPGHFTHTATASGAGNPVDPWSKRLVAALHRQGLRPARSKRHRAQAGWAAVLSLAAVAMAWLALTPRTLQPLLSPGQSTAAPAVETAPFAGALNALTTAPQVHYLSMIPGVGTVDAEVTNFGQLIGSLTEDGSMFHLLWVGGKLYVKPPASGLPGVTSQRDAAALTGKWLTGSEVQRILGFIPAQFVSPAQLATKLAIALGTAPTRKGVVTIDGAPVVGADTSLGVLYVALNAPYHIVTLSPSADRSTALPSTGTSELTAYTVAGDEASGNGMSFPVDPPSDGIANTDQQIENQTRQLATESMDSDLHFNVAGNGSIECSAAECSVTVTVTNSIGANSTGTTIIGGSVEANLIAAITIEGEPAGGCNGQGSLPLDGTGVLMCDDPSAGEVFASVDEEKKAQAEAESKAEGGAEIPYQINFGGQYVVYARAQVNVAELEQQVVTQARNEGPLQHAYDDILSGAQRARNRTAAEMRASLSPEELASGKAHPRLRAAYIGTSIEKAIARDPAVASNPDILHMGSSRPGIPVADFKIRIGGKPITLDVTAASASSISSHRFRSYIQSGPQLILYPALTRGFINEVFR